MTGVPTNIPGRPHAQTFALFALWIVFYASFTLFTPALLDDADSVHAEVAREMLLRHDYVTLYANGIRYLEKAPLLYWSMAVAMRGSQFLGQPSANALAVSARIPLALTVLGLAFAVEIFARRAFRSARAGLYATLILLSSFGVFLFTRILLPDAMLCLWLTLALLCFWMTEELEGARNQATHSSRSITRDEQNSRKLRLFCYGFAACCALGALTKGLIGVVFPVAIIAIYLLLSRGPRGAVDRALRLHPFSSALVFLAIAAPWHILAAWNNPTRGHPGDLSFTLQQAPHWAVPLPTQGNVHGWAWFYFINEQVLRYFNLRVPRDYDTVPLWLFWGLCLVWLMPWSAFVFKAIATALPIRSADWRRRFRSHMLDDRARSQILLLIWAITPLIFFSFSTRQEYYVLPALPAAILLIASWLQKDSLVTVVLAQAPGQREGGTLSQSTVEYMGLDDPEPESIRGPFLIKGFEGANTGCTAVLLALGTLFAAASVFFLLHARAPAPDTDLASLLQQNPGDYALSMGHLLDLNAQALSLFRLPLELAAASLFLGPLASYLLRRQARPHAATLALAAGAFGFLMAAHLGLRTFSPVLSSQQLAAAIAPQLQPDDLVVIHQEYEFGSTLGFYLQRPSYSIENGRPVAINPIRILTDPEHNGVRDYGRSSNLWYGSFFPDAPAIFETQQSLARKWSGPQRIFLWQDLAGEPSLLPALPSPVYVIAKSGGKEIVSNQPNR